ncbi:MAG TPA: hypothetical protein VF707_10040, partial [Ardenticatenaceae bacterium]
GMRRTCEALSLARVALMCYEYAPAVPQAVNELRQLIQTLGEVPLEMEQWSWPHALLRQLEAHHERLHHS